MTSRNTLDQYVEMLTRLSDGGVNFLRIKDSLHKSASMPDKINCFLRHDVDYDVECAYDMAVEESRLGIRSTYYILTTDTASSYWSNKQDVDRAINMIKSMQDMGHEVGLHYDVFGDWFCEDLRNIDSKIKDDLDLMRQNGIKVETCAAHGSARINALLSYNSKVDYAIRKKIKNQSIWEASPGEQVLINIGEKNILSHSLRLKDYGLNVEAYFAPKSAYIADQRSKESPGMVDIAWGTKNIFKVLSKDFLDIFYNSIKKEIKLGESFQFLIHPHQWRKKGVTPKSISFGQKVAATNYDKFYMGDGFKYSESFIKSHLATHNTSLLAKADPELTLLDVGSGDGCWANFLSRYYRVTAEEPSLMGTLKGSCKDEFNKVTWICGRSDRLVTVHDIVFARCPSFFNRKIDEVFVNSFEHIFARTRKKLIFIVASKKPFNRTTGSSWMHCPKTLQSFFQKYGNTRLKHSGGYIFAEIKRVSDSKVELL